MELSRTISLVIHLDENKLRQHTHRRELGALLKEHYQIYARDITFLTSKNHVSVGGFGIHEINFIIDYIATG